MACAGWLTVNGMVRGGLCWTAFDARGCCDASRHIFGGKQPPPLNNPPDNEDQGPQLIDIYEIMANPQMARLACRSYLCSSRVLMTVRRGGVRRSKPRGASQKPCPPLIRTLYTKGGMIRYFGVNGTNEHDASDFDRTKFTHEVKIEMPNVGDDIECECPVVSTTILPSVENYGFIKICAFSKKIAGVIEKWHKKEGDLIKRDDVICDIRTEVIIPVCYGSRCSNRQEKSKTNTFHCLHHIALYIWDVNR